MSEKQKKPHRFLWWLFGFGSAVVIEAGVLAFMPVKYYFGGDTKGAVNEDIANGGLLDVLLHYKEYTVGDFPVVQTYVNQLMDKNNLSGFFSIDYDAINGVLLTDNDLGNKLKANVKITATLRMILDRVGYSNILGSFASLPVFQEWTPVETTPDPTAESFNAALYYWKQDETYVRAFGQDKKPVEGVELGTTPLFYPALMDIGIMEFPSVILDRAKMSKVIDIMKAAGFGDETSTIGKIVKENTIGDMAHFSVNSIHLSDILTPDDSNATLYRVLISGCRAEDGSALAKEEITIGDIRKMDVNKVLLSDIVTQNDNNKKVTDILAEATGKANYAEVSIGDLSFLDTNRVKLSDFMSEDEANATFVNVIKDAAKKEDYSEITLGDLSGIDFKIVKLSSFLKATESNQDALSAFASGCGKANYEDVTVGDLDTWNGDNVKLDPLFPESENKDFYSLIRDLTGKETGDIYFSDLHDLDLQQLHLKTVLSVDKHQALYDLLTDMSGDGTKTAETLQLKDLSTFETGKLHLTKVLPNDGDNANLYHILTDVTGKDATSICVSDLNHFDSGKIHLTSVLPESSNPSLYQILGDALGLENNNITIADLSTFNADKVKLSSVYAIEGHDSFYQLLSEATGKAAGEITISDLNSFTTGNIRLASVLNPSENETLYKILCESVTTSDGSAVTSDTVKIDDLSRFDPANIHLKSVLKDDGNNRFIKALLAKDTTVGNIGTTLNQFPLVDLYGDKCFQEEPGESGGWNVDAYRRTEDENGRYVYTLVEGVTPATGDEYYYVSPESSIWLMLCYDAATPSDVSKAVPTSYTPSALTVNDWEDGTKISDTMTKSILYEIYASHLVTASKAKSEYSSLVLRQTLGTIVSAL